MNFVIKDYSTGNIKMFYGNSISSIEYNPKENYLKISFHNYAAAVKLRGAHVGAAAQILQQEFIHGTENVDLTAYQLYESNRSGIND